MSDLSYIKWVRTLKWQALLREILHNPEYLADPYYRAFGDALRARAYELLRENP